MVSSHFTSPSSTIEAITVAVNDLETEPIWKRVLGPFGELALFTTGTTPPDAISRLLSLRPRNPIPPAIFCSFTPYPLERITSPSR